MALAREFVESAAEIDARAGWSDRQKRRRLRALVGDEHAADFTVRLTDEVVRIGEPRHAAHRFSRLVSQTDLSAFPLVDRLLLRAGVPVAARLPRLVMPLVTRRLRAESAGVILPAEDPGFARHLARRRRDGIRCNVNVLGEAIVGDDESRRRLGMVVDRLRRDDVDYVSVKISAICPSISALAFDDTVDRVAERLRALYRVAASYQPAKFVNLDMEEYADLDLTVAAFRRVLDESEFASLDAGIVLQAYLPDVRDVAHELGTWAARRRAAGGGRIKVRIVKGANLAMETVEAELAGWPTAPYDDKTDVDANYKAVLDVLLDPAFDDAVRIGVASHNLFDVAWAVLRRDDLRHQGRPARIELEMLEGMAPSQADVVREVTGDLLLYAPVVARRDFPAAIAYLVRRLDENTSPDNFLAHLFDLADDRERFELEADRFRESVRRMGTVATTPRRTQDRSSRPSAYGIDTPFVNAPDTDWTRVANRRWIADAFEAGPFAWVRPKVSPADVDAAVETARRGGLAWSERTVGERAGILDRVGDAFEADRGRILATMAADAGKTIEQGDPEVSEGVDFARWYARDAVRLAATDGASGSPLGVVAVVPPWNFPFAIPAGGVLASLAAGNGVVFKPAPQTARTAALIAELCWEAGVPRDVLQFSPAGDDDAGRRLVTHSDVDAVVLTGGYDTARMFFDWRPDLRLHAETSGKNAIVVTAAADLDHAVADIVHSAFAHAGQKCSAASLVIVEASLYDDRAFLERIRDAAATLHVGPADDPATDVGPLIEPPGEKLRRGLTSLEPGESWLLAPRRIDDDDTRWTPGIRVGVLPDTWFARTECFGPVLGIVRADDLDHAIAIQNAVDYGLTAGLHSLDPDEIDHWLERVEAGNVYVNRGITGAIVGRQPFGGWKRSSVGPTAKAGGPSYVATLMRWADDDVPVETIGRRFATWMAEVGDVEIDVTGLEAERNGFRYRSLPGGVAVRFGPGVAERDRALVDLAARASRCRLVLSDASTEPPERFAGRLAGLGVDRLRLLADDPDHVVRRAANAIDVSVDDAPPVGAPEIELPRWLHEQAVCVTRHRHGRIIRPTAPGA